MERKILIVSAELTLRDLLRCETQETKYACTTVADGQDAVARLEECHFDVVFLDMKLESDSALQLLSELRSKQSSLAVIVVIAVNDIPAAVEAMRLGASGCVVRPLAPNRLNGSRTMQGNQTTSESASDIDAIASGVEVNLDPCAGFAQAVIQRTVELARRMDLPEEEIDAWAEARLNGEIEKRRRVALALEKLRRSPVAQRILGLTATHLHAQKSSNRRN